MEKNHTNANSLKNFHIGFSILKSILSFCVIINHCYNYKSTKNKIIFFVTKRRRIHVPSFFIMSFYLNHNMLISYDFKKKFNRFERLLIPYLGWPLFVFIISNLIKYFVKFDIFLI